MQRGHLMNHGRVECLWQLWKRWIDEVERRGGRRENNQFQGGRSPGQPAEHNWGGVLLPRPFPIPTLCPPRFDPWFQNTRLYPYFGIPNIRPILLLAHASFSNAADGLSEKSNHRPPPSDLPIPTLGIWRYHLHQYLQPAKKNYSNTLVPTPRPVHHQAYFVASEPSPRGLKIVTLT